MLRYAPALRSRCAALTVEVPPRMLSLAPMFEGVSDVITWGSLAPAHPPAWDVQIECMELPYLFRTHQHQLPIATNYLKLPPEIQANVTTAMGPHKMPRVGVVWAAGEWNPSRSIPFSCIFQILQTRDCEFWNLQGGRDADEWRSLPHHLSLRDARECGEGLISLAAVIEQLDLVITVDTLAAHLAGALGTPTWVLLQSAADWRWMIHRTDSPWYPSLRLYRQHNAGSWGTVFNNVTADLARWLSHARQAERAG
ncbi:MAG: hypothetical protein NVS9B15_24110 [Acidobacteriaceae bacterium]